MILSHYKKSTFQTLVYSQVSKTDISGKRQIEYTLLTKNTSGSLKIARLIANSYQPVSQEEKTLKGIKQICH